MENDFFNLIFEKHPNFRQRNLGKRRIKHVDILPLFTEISKAKFVELNEAGRSCENRQIFSLKFGTGKIKILLWSQMHGDESTATRAFFDVFRFFTEKSDFEPEKAEILNTCTLYFIPMLNPDGAERYQRRNAAGIDINRDARQQSSPEAQILSRMQKETQADFGFNMHDQSPYYSAGKSHKPAAVSFLSPAYDEAKSINTGRKSGMQIIAALNKRLQQKIPGMTGRYSDAFMPNAFGDYIQQKHTSTILFESGSLPDDLEKEKLRQLNFTMMLSALQIISRKDYLRHSISDYEKIPFIQKEKLFDIIIKDVRLACGQNKMKVDLGFRRNFGTDKDKLFLADIGDLADKGAFKIINAEAVEIKKVPEIGEAAGRFKNLFSACP